MSSDEASRPTLAFIGGTGPEGRGLALRFSRAGYPVIIGSRSAPRAQEAAETLTEAAGLRDVSGMENGEAARDAEIVFLVIPYGAVKDTLPPLREAVAGKVVVSAIAPIEFPEGRPVAIQVEAGSAAQEVQELLPEAQVVSAFQIVDAHQLQDVDAPLETDVLVCSDHVEARRLIVRMASEIPGVRGLSAGRLSSSRYLEECTALLITINRIYKVHSGLRITGIDR